MLLQRLSNISNIIAEVDQQLKVLIRMVDIIIDKDQIIIIEAQ
jgi:hypothetical protein